MKEIRFMGKMHYHDYGIGWFAISDSKLDLPANVKTYFRQRSYGDRGGQYYYKYDGFPYDNDFWRKSKYDGLFDNEKLYAEILLLFEWGFELSNDYETKCRFKYVQGHARTETEYRQKKNRARRIYDNYLEKIKKEKERKELAVYTECYIGKKTCPITTESAITSQCMKCKYYSSELDECGK